MPEPGDADTDEALVERFRQGDETAFDLLVRRHRSAVYGTARRLAGGHVEADDLAQEAFLRAYRSLRRFRGEARLGTWLTRIVVNLALTARQTRRPTLPLDQAGPLGVAAGALDSTLRLQVRRAVDRLPPRQRQVLVLKVYAGFKFVEIAEMAGISVGTAKATFFQAVRGLRVRLVPRALGSPQEEGVGS